MIVPICSNPLRASIQSIGLPRRAQSCGAAVLALLVLLAPAHIAEAKEHQFVGVKRCRTCHKKEPIGNQYGVWLNSKHAKAYETLASEKAKNWASEMGIDDPQTHGECLRCHTTAHGVPDELAYKKIERSEGVGCEACHGPGKDYRKKKVMIDNELSVAKGMIPQSEKVCVTCHNDDSRAWDPERYTRADATKVGFDYEQAVARIAHPVPEAYDPEASKDDEDEEE